jgi:putative transposase
LFTSILESKNIRISMDSKWRYADNIFVERLWRSIKQEEVYLREYDSPLEAISSIRKYMLFYNSKRPHQSLGYKTPQEIYDLSILTQKTIA